MDHITHTKDLHYALRTSYSVGMSFSKSARSRFEILLHAADFLFCSGESLFLFRYCLACHPLKYSSKSFSHGWFRYHVGRGRNFFAVPHDKTPINRKTLTKKYQIKLRGIFCKRFQGRQVYSYCARTLKHGEHRSRKLPKSMPKAMLANLQFPISANSHLC